jgi:aminomethyltransferase
MGYPLYGHDIDATTSPVEADLGWIISKKTDAYPGYDRIVRELADGVSRKRVGVRLLDKGVAREGTEIRNTQDEKIGVLTSGGFSPSLKESIGQGYVDPAFAVPGKKIFVNVRGRNIAAEVASMPFVPAKTKSMKKKEAA